MTKYVYEVDRWDSISEEVFLFKQALNSKEYRHIHKAIASTYNDLDTIDKNYIPIGSINFVQKQLYKCGNFKMHPIEVPQILRTQEFLGRDYTICKYDELPKKGYWFIKNASSLKSFSGIINVKDLHSFYNLSEEDYNSLWIYSTPIQFVSEFRFYILDDKIMNYSMYEFIPQYVHLQPDVIKVQKMISLYSQVPHPEAYTLDVGITADDNTYIFEIHPFTSVGLYTTTIYGIDLLDMYNKGYEWYKTEANQPLIT